MMGQLRVEHAAKVDENLLDQLGVPSTRFYTGELDRIQLAQRGHGATTYVVARDANEHAVGMAPVYVTSTPWHAAVDPAVLFDPSLPVSPSTLGLAGSHGVYANYLSGGARVDDRDAAQVAGVLVEQARAIARAAGCEYVMLPYLDETQARWLEAYWPSAAAVSVCEKAVLPVSWHSFDDYVSCLPTRRRTGVRRERRRLRESGIDVRELRMVDAAGELAPLLVQTEKRYGRDADPRQIEFHYTLLGMHLDEDFTALVAYQRDRPVACSLLLACGNRWISKAWGCDYTALDDPFLYFNLTFYEPVIRAIERGFEVLDYGLHALDSKTQRGCTVQRLQTILIAADD